jgi:two-component system, sensor histidine kinase PdtaS
MKKEREYVDILFNKANDAVFMFHLDENGLPGRLIEVNDVMCSRLGYSREELSGMSLVDVYSSRFQDLISTMTADLMASRSVIFETAHTTRDGMDIPIETSSHLFYLNGKATVLSIARDITERRTVEAKLKASLREKETLLKEIHHRVKNNMQIVSSMLSLQASRFDNPEMHEAFLKSQGLIKAMAFVHENLYKTENMSEINFSIFLEQNLIHLFRAYGRHDITFCLQPSQVHLDADIAVPVALVVTELVTNSLKHAFPGRKGGKIDICLAPSDNGMVRLTIRDDGIGLPGEIDYDHSSPLGLQLVKSLVAQIGGTISHRVQEGTAFTLAFNPSRDAT